MSTWEEFNCCCILQNNSQHKWNIQNGKITVRNLPLLAAMAQCLARQSIITNNKQLDSWTTSRLNFIHSHHGSWGQVPLLLSLAWKSDHIPQEIDKRSAAAYKALFHYHLVGSTHSFPHSKLLIPLLRLRGFQTWLPSNARPGGDLTGALWLVREAALSPVPDLPAAGLL